MEDVRRVEKSRTTPSASRPPRHPWLGILLSTTPAAAPPPLRQRRGLFNENNLWSGIWVPSIFNNITFDGGGSNGVE
ncbi:MAG: hypothetical protein LBB23_00230 [Rickettsiales bacterium]|nr:hypothetical protein [Rickettsiales bacterium]